MVANMDTTYISNVRFIWIVRTWVIEFLLNHREDCANRNRRSKVGSDGESEMVPKHPPVERETVGFH
jgi:hypothetical protein